MSENVPTMLTMEETAKRTGLSYEYIRKLCKNGKIVFVKSGRKYLINFTRFVEYLNTGEGSSVSIGSDGDYHDRHFN